MVISRSDSDYSSAGGGKVYNAPRKRNGARNVRTTPSNSRQTPSSAGSFAPSYASSVSNSIASKTQYSSLPGRSSSRHSQKGGGPKAPMPPMIPSRMQPISNSSRSPSCDSSRIKSSRSRNQLPPKSPSSPIKTNVISNVRKSPPRRIRSRSPRHHISPSASRSSRNSGRTSYDSKSKASSKKSNRTTFHVRVSLGYMTGIKISQTSKKKKRSGAHNSLVIGYATLARSHKQMAFSQPLVPSFAEGSSKTRQQKLIWASKRNSDEFPVAAAKTKRRLHFSVHMEPEAEPVVDDDESAASRSNFSPEVVKIFIGLKCREERIPLGVANLVIHGKEKAGEKIDLSLRPISECPEVEIPSGMRKTTRRGIFGSKQQIANEFSVGDHSYGLASNATLRVRVDAKQGFQGQTKEEIWGDGYGDDESLHTNASFDQSTLASYCKAKGQPISFGHTDSTVRMGRPSNGNVGHVQYNQRDNASVDKSFLSEWVEVMPNQQGTTIVASPKGKLPLEKEQLLLEAMKKAPRPKYKRPLSHVIVKKPFIPDGRSLVSGLTHPQDRLQPYILMKACFPDMCGDFDESLRDLEPTFSYESAIHNQVHQSWDDDDTSLTDNSPDLDARSIEDDSEADDDSETRDDGESHDGSDSKHMEKKFSTECSNSDIEGQQSKDDQSQQMRQKPLEQQQRQPSVKSEQDVSREVNDIRDSIEPEQNVMDDVVVHDEVAGPTLSMDTYSDLKEAQETLLRYANKMGIEMEDLLDGIESKPSHIATRPSSVSSIKYDL